MTNHEDSSRGAAPPAWTPERAQRLWQWVQATAWLETVSDVELGDLLEAEVWADLPLRSTPSDLVAEAIARLRGERQQEDET